MPVLPISARLCHAFMSDSHGKFLAATDTRDKATKVTDAVLTNLEHDV